MKIQIFGPGCPRCKQTEENAMKAVTDLGVGVDIEKVTDINKIIEFGVMATPALAVDGEIKFSGKIPSVEEIKDALK